MVSNLTNNRACNVLDVIEWSLYGIEDTIGAKNVLAPHLGFLQTLLIWCSCQGREMEDKDFGALNLAQFVQLFQEARKVVISVDILERIFMELLELNGEKGSYQMSTLEFLPAIFFVASESF
ncbi:hypothetical protein GOP47_0017006 [Adiantum capillus-veneris]|uniref:Uncharacterized protein n=1 Tax=Adiantum capillus-veneris TaxID=13818 RepID=A0A9D4UIR9_ADICA|nr:hypothetical protein GOP47_0017006 [Adiantum capillus-veneris]